MTEFDPEKSEDKYANYFPEFQHAYKNAFEMMNDEFDPPLTRGVDQQIINESESSYDDGDLSVQLPDDPVERLIAVRIDDDELNAVLDHYVDEIGSELRRIFGVEA